MKKFYYFLLFIATTSIFLQAETFRYRAILKLDPSHSITIGWDQKYFYTLPNSPLTFGPPAVLYYDTVDHGQDVSKYRHWMTGSDRTWAKSMLNSFVTLAGLKPNTKYYFVIEDGDGVSERFWFKTFPKDNRKLFFVAGGDSRSNQDIRRRGNKLVSKLKPDAVFFGGDMTFYDDIIGDILPFDDYLSLPYSVILDIILKNPITDFFVKLITDEEFPPYFHEWKVWFDDWQLTTTDDGRLIPIIPARGNHELSNESISTLFNTNEEVIYGHTFGNNLLRLYTLNSEAPILGEQKDWIEKDMAEHRNKVVWQLAQYHTSILPHSTTKDEYPELMEFANLFTKYGLDLSIECDTHVVKTTYPISVSDNPDSEKGFLEDQENGTVYVGEGTWGAPLRENDNNKRWTRHSGFFNQYSVIFVDNQKLEVRVLDFDQNNPDILNIPDNENKFSEILRQVNFWNPNNEGTIILENKLKPVVKFTSPTESNFSPIDVKNNPLVFRVEASAIVKPDHYTNINKIEKVKFYVNNQYHSTDDYPPYEMVFEEKQQGHYNIKAVAYDQSYFSKIDGVMGEATKTISLGEFSREVKVELSSTEDDAIEFSNGWVDLRGDVLPFYKTNEIRKIGTKFKSVEIPKNAFINDAYVVLKAKTNNGGRNLFKINVENSGRSKPYFPSKGNISKRPILDGVEVNWDLESNANEVRTPNLSCLISSLIRSENWQDKGDVNLIFEEISNGNTNPREFFSYNSSSSEKPFLVINYTIKTDWEKVVSPRVSFRTEKYNHSYNPKEYFNKKPLVLNVNADSDKSRVFNKHNEIKKVDFFVNNEFHTSDVSWPYTIKLSDNTVGLYVVEAVATDLYGFTSKSTRLISFGNFTKEIEVPIENSSNFSLENMYGVTQLGIQNNYLLNQNQYSLLGLRFEEIALPTYANIENAYIKFASDPNQSKAGFALSSKIAVENKANTNSFVQNCSDISSRTLFSEAVINWDTNEQNTTVKTPNLSNLISEIIHKPEWLDYSGINFVLNSETPSSLSLFLPKTITEGIKDNLPKLVIKYSVKTESAELESNDRVSVYPSLLDRSNPTLNILPNDGLKYVRVLIYNQSSEIAFDKELKSSEKQSVDLGALPSGIYFLQAVGQNGEIYKRTKILKQ